MSNTGRVGFEVIGSWPSCPKRSAGRAPFSLRRPTRQSEPSLDHATLGCARASGACSAGPVHQRSPLQFQREVNVPTWPVPPHAIDDDPGFI